MTNEFYKLLSTFIKGGVVQMGLTVPRTATYIGSTGAFTPPATPTDMFVIEGSATKVVRILKVELNGTQTTDGINAFFLNKHSTANAGGTAIATTLVPVDSTNSAVTATAKHYTANGTPGTSVTLFRTSILTPAPASLLTPIYVWDFTNGLQQPVVLRGVTQGLAINFAGAALPAGLSLSVNVVFTESDN